MIALIFSLLCVPCARAQFDQADGKLGTSKDPLAMDEYMYQYDQDYEYSPGQDSSLPLAEAQSPMLDRLLKLFGLSSSPDESESPPMETAVDAAEDGTGDYLYQYGDYEYGLEEMKLDIPLNTSSVQPVAGSMPLRDLLFGSSPLSTIPTGEVANEKMEHDYYQYGDYEYGQDDSDGASPRNHSAVPHDMSQSSSPDLLNQANLTKKEMEDSMYQYDDYEYSGEDGPLNNSTALLGNSSSDSQLNLFAPVSVADKFLLCENLPKLKSLENDQLLEFAQDEDFLENKLPDICTASISVLLEKLPESFVLNITSTPGLLQKFNDDQIVEFAQNFKMLNNTSESVLINLIDSRPRIVTKLPMKVFEEFIRRKSFIRGLKNETLISLYMSDELTAKLLRLPHEAIGTERFCILFVFNKIACHASIIFFHSLAEFVTHSPESLSMLPLNYPSKALISKLLIDRDFLRLIPVEIHAQLAESNFRKHLSTAAVQAILWVYPGLPLHFSEEGILLNKKYFTNLRFLKGLPCEMYLLLAQDMNFVNRLDPEVLSVMAKNRRMWRCLPVEVIRTMLRDSNVGSKITIKDVMNATTQMSKVKSLDRDVILNLFLYQMPRHAVSNIQYMIDMLRS